MLSSTTLQTPAGQTRSKADAEELSHWLALRLVAGLGTRKSFRLLQTYKTPQAVFRATSSELEGWGLPGGIARSIASGCTFDDAVDQTRKLDAAGAQLVTLNDPRYPARLREIYDPPIVLFALGDPDKLDSLMVAIVGTRKPTPYGTNVAEKLAADLGNLGLGVVSGMARGIDTAAHRGAMSVKAETVAVLGCGVDVIYPSENKKLHEDIARCGVVISEFPMGAPAFPQNFPIRNRIISGLSLGVLIVEGAQYSGSTITARLAIDQNREVFAVPGNITSKPSWAPNLLIKQGAKLVQDASDVIEEFTDNDRAMLSAIRELRNTSIATQTRLDLNPMAAIEEAILERLHTDTSTHIDALLESLENYSSSELVAALFELELLGKAKQLPGKNFVKVWDGTHSR